MFDDVLEFHESQTEFIRELKNKVAGTYSEENIATSIYALKQLNEMNKRLITLLENQLEEEVKKN
jgi:hypothetical protein